MPNRNRLAIVMISLNEAHNMEAVLENISDIADEVFLLDSYSKDQTVEIALKHGVKVYQRKFVGFGDQWDYAVNQLPITSEWTMKLDPDERFTDTLKANLLKALDEKKDGTLSVTRRLWFLGKPMPVKQKILRVWRTGMCSFGDVLINEHPIADGENSLLEGDLEHHDSPSLDHWIAKQNKYSTAEAKIIHENLNLSTEPNLFGSGLERRMFLKKIYRHIPGRHLLMFMYCFVIMGAWKAGKTGFHWAMLRVWLFRVIEIKLDHMRRSKTSYHETIVGTGSSHPDAIQCHD